MKSLWMLCVLAAGLAVSAGCGPQEKFCPNIGKNGVCPIAGDDAAIKQFDSGSGNNGGTGCQPGTHLMCDSNGNCVCTS